MEKVLSPFLTNIFKVFISVQAKFSLHRNNSHHIIIGTNLLFFLVISSYISTAVILILEYATLLHSSGTNRHLALEQAQLHYIQSAHTGAVRQFPAAFQDYCKADYVQFILDNRLSSNK